MDISKTIEHALDNYADKDYVNRRLYEIIGKKELEKKEASSFACAFSEGAIIGALYSIPGRSIDNIVGAKIPDTEKSRLELMKYYGMELGTSIISYLAQTEDARTGKPGDGFQAAGKLTAAAFILVLNYLDPTEDSSKITRAAQSWLSMFGLKDNTQ